MVPTLKAYPHLDLSAHEEHYTWHWFWLLPGLLMMCCAPPHSSREQSWHADPPEHVIMHWKSDKKHLWKQHAFYHIIHISGSLKHGSCRGHRLNKTQRELGVRKWVYKHVYAKVRCNHFLHAHNKYRNMFLSILHDSCITETDLLIRMILTVQINMNHMSHVRLLLRPTRKNFGACQLTLGPPSTMPPYLDLIWLYVI